MGRRVYSDDEIERLQLLQFGARAGRRIGDVASWLREDLLAICDSFACLKPIRKLDLATLDPRCTTCVAISLPVLL
jgi:DNA-binding transcriptional MerR regulator